MTPSVVALLFLQLQLPAPTGYVNDFAHVVQPAQTAAMQGVIDQVHSSSAGEIVVVTLPDLGGRAAIDVARDIGRQWKVGARGEAGDARRNTGVVLLLKPGQRPGDGQAEIAIATGNGVEGFITDALAGRIRDAIGRTAVEAGSYGAGLAEGVRLLGEAYGREFGFQLTGQAAQPARPARQAPKQPGGFPTWVFVVIILFVVLANMGGRRRRGGSGLANAIIWGMLSNVGRGGGGGGGGGGSWGGGGFGGFGGGGGFSGGGASGRF